MNKNNAQYQFTTFNNGGGLSAYASYNRLYVEGFVRGLNAGRWTKHRLDEKNPTRVDTHGWSYGIPTRHYDGRITSRDCSWVYAKKLGNEPKGAVATVFFTSRDEPIGFLVKAEKGQPEIDPADIQIYTDPLKKLKNALEQMRKEAA